MQVKLGIFNNGENDSLFDALESGAVHVLSLCNVTSLSETSLNLSNELSNALHIASTTLESVGNHESFTFTIYGGDVGTPTFTFNTTNGQWVKDETIADINQRTINSHMKLLYDGKYRAYATQSPSTNNEYRVYIVDYDMNVVSYEMDVDVEYDITLSDVTFDVYLKKTDDMSDLIIDLYNVIFDDDKNHITNTNFDYSIPCSVLTDHDLLHEIGGSFVGSKEYKATINLLTSNALFNRQLVHDELATLRKYKGMYYTIPCDGYPIGDEIYQMLHNIARILNIDVEIYDVEVANVNQ